MRFGFFVPSYELKPLGGFIIREIVETVKDPYHKDKTINERWREYENDSSYRDDRVR